MKSEEAKHVWFENALRKVKIFRRGSFFAGLTVLATIVSFRWGSDLASNISHAISLLPCLFTIFQSAELAYIRALTGLKRKKLSIVKEVASCLLAFTLFAGASLLDDHTLFFGGACALLIINMNWMETELRTLFSNIGDDINT